MEQPGRVAKHLQVQAAVDRVTLDQAAVGLDVIRLDLEQALRRVQAKHIQNPVHELGCIWSLWRLNQDCIGNELCCIQEDPEWRGTSAAQSHYNIRQDDHSSDDQQYGKKSLYS